MINQKITHSIPKKTAEKLSKFDYYIDTLLPTLFEELNHSKTLSHLQSKGPKPLNKLLSKQTSRGIIYNYFYSKCENSSAINQQSILASVKKLYLNQDVIKINNMSFGRKMQFKKAYLPIYGLVSQIVDFVVLNDVSQISALNLQKEQHKEKKETNNPALTSPNKGNLRLNKSNVGRHNDNPKTLKTVSNKPKDYWVYVVHSCNSFKNQSDDQPNYFNSNQQVQLVWEYFIQRYHFTGFAGIEKNQKDVGQIEYQLIYSYKPQSSSILWNFQQNLTKEFIASHCKIQAQSTDANTLQTLEKLQGYLLLKSTEVEESQKKQNDVAFSEQHRRQHKIPIEYFKHYTKLKQEVYKFYLDLHELEQQSQINKYFYENLICRYLIAKQYHFEQAKKSILEYLKWEKQLTEKYPSLQSFREVHEIGAYRYIGQDFMGRPVILNKAALVDVTTMTTQEAVSKYCDYYIYFLEIYLRTKMRGYVDQMVIIADLQNLGTKNFKLAITKRNVADSLKYGPERQLSLCAVNVSSYAYPIWTFIKPLLPKKTLHKIQIVNNNKKDILKALTDKMDIKVIPEYLGGQNNNIVSDLKDDEFSGTRTQLRNRICRQKSVLKASNISNNGQIQIKRSYKQKIGYEELDLQKSVVRRTHMVRERCQELQESERMEIMSVESILIQNKQRKIQQSQSKKIQQKPFFNIFSSFTKILGFSQQK